MRIEIKATVWSVLLGCAMALGSCSYGRPPQTGFYCVDIPQGGSAADAGRFVRTIADQLDFNVSEAQFPSEKGPPNNVWEAYGRGVSLFVGTAMKDGKQDRYGNSETTFNPNRLGLHVVKTGLWQRVELMTFYSRARHGCRIWLVIHEGRCRHGLRHLNVRNGSKADTPPRSGMGGKRTQEPP